MTEYDQRILAACAGLLICLFVLGSFLRTERRRTGPKASVIGTVIGRATSREDGVETSAAIIRYAVNDNVFEITDEIWQPWPTSKVGVRVRLLYPIGRPQDAYRPRPLLRGLVAAGLVALGGAMVAILLGRL
ncbi:hypothetical protein [Phenylobacterium conjunctum]|uniref:DUF3592 domain-containing protein n=1 Tax=Phenylobacterium conjunctum TaxID=1298959 RepID=A0ABW3SXS7_9CAUL